ncbi:rod shape-determining protein MreC [Nocardioides nematodiphilus]|uniref:rod shape-determining protein MreC n=1 Tax=Nocardioides nematodiphilus TaxID=2849669 RepID=UPI001CDA3EE0|nr:rod shape-determining protein MreC [Nocardioides nematodiphilus]MCA1984136.1 rod shape-determining protein MreC [Nocardioides nematodiphilus]
MTQLQSRPAAGREGINRRGSLEPRDPRSPRRSTAVALLLACATLITLDKTGGVLDPVRRVTGEVLGPAESAVSTVARPITSVPGWFHTRDGLKSRIADLQEQNAKLQEQVRTSDLDRNRLAEYDGLTRTAESIGYAVVPSRVIALGPAQSFHRTATIDAGSASGVRPDMTVVAAQGLVGRVLRVTSTTATVLLITDGDSTVGGRVGSSMKVGFVHGDSDLGDGGANQLELQLVDRSSIPRRGDTVVTWGSAKAAPYVSGVPIGQVTSAYASVRDSSTTAAIAPFVDFGALDLVGVVVPSGTSSDRAIIDADGRLKK